MVGRPFCGGGLLGGGEVEQFRCRYVRRRQVSLNSIPLTPQRYLNRLRLTKARLRAIAIIDRNRVPLRFWRQ